MHFGSLAPEVKHGKVTRVMSLCTHSRQWIRCKDPAANFIYVLSSTMSSPSPPPPLQHLLAEKDCTPSCLLPRTLAAAAAADADAPGRSVCDHQHKLLPFRPTTSSFSSTTPRNRHLTLDNHELAGLVAALERARNEARHHSSIAQQLRRENERLRAELELKNNQLDAILHHGGKDPEPGRHVFLPSSPTSTLQDTEDLGCGDDVTTKAVQTLLRNFDSFNLLSKDIDNSDEDGDDRANALIGEDLLSDDDDSCSYSV